MRILTPQNLKTVASGSVTTPSAGEVILFADSDNKVKQKDSTGTVTDLTSTTKVGITGTTAQFNTALTDGDFATLAGTETLTNKRVSKRVQTITSTATLTPSWDTDDNIFITAQASNITIANPTGTPVNGQTIMIRIKFNAVYTITYGTNYRAFVAALPTAGVAGKTLFLGLIANTTDSKVDTTSMSEV